MENEPINRRLWEILRELGRLKSLDPADEEVERRRELLREQARPILWEAKPSFCQCDR